VPDEIVAIGRVRGYLGMVFAIVLVVCVLFTASSFLPGPAADDSGNDCWMIVVAATLCRAQKTEIHWDRQAVQAIQPDDLPRPSGRARGYRGRARSFV
jgi:hypothetical protein